MQLGLPLQPLKHAFSGDAPTSALSPCAPCARSIGVNWSYAALYVPSFLPFICTGCATLLAFRRSIPPDRSWRDPFAAAGAKCRGGLGGACTSKGHAQQQPGAWMRLAAEAKGPLVLTQ